MNNIDLMKFWIESSDEDYNVMNVLYENKKNSWCLFLGHLVIEKLLKGLYAKNNSENPSAPKIHNLILLSQKAKLEVPYDYKSYSLSGPQCYFEDKEEINKVAEVNKGDKISIIGVCKGLSVLSPTLENCSIK